MPPKTQSESIILKNIGEFARKNQIVELKDALAKQQTALNGNRWWDYDNDEHDVEFGFRDAILAGFDEVVQLLLDAGIGVNQYIKQDKGLVTPIQLAAQAGKLSMVKLLVERGAKIYITENDNRENRNNDFGMRSAVKAGHADIVEYLLACGADANGLCGGGTLGEAYGGTTFLARAAEDGHLRIVEALVRAGASIKSTIGLAHEKLYKHRYERYQSVLERDYSDEQRIEILPRCQIFRNHNSVLYKDYSLRQNAKEFFDALNIELNDITLFINDENRQLQFLQNLIQRFYKKFNITLADTPDKLKKDFIYALKQLQEFDEKKSKLEKEAAPYKTAYVRIVNTCLDYAFGLDFEPKEEGVFGGSDGGLLFLHGLYVSLMNFVGVSVGGKPVTRDDLLNEKLAGADKALVTIHDINALTDKARKSALLGRLNTATEQLGKRMSEDGIVSLIPFASAVELGQVTFIESRLATVDLNLEKKPLLVKAAEQGNLELVKLLAARHAHLSVNQTKYLTEKALELFNQVPQTSCFSLVNGILKPFPIIQHHEQFMILIPGEKQFTSLTGLMRKLKSIKMSQMISSYFTENPSMNNVLIVNHEGHIEYISYKDSADMESVHKGICGLIENAYKTRDCYPAIIAKRNNFKVIESMIRYQYNKIDKCNSYIIEAIEAARKNNHSAIVENLQEHQDINQQNKDGKTLLHLAVIQGDIKRVRELIQKGADVNLEDKQGTSPLLSAVKFSSEDYRKHNEHFEIFELLLANNADTQLESLLDVAVASGNVNVLARLLPIAPKPELVRRDWGTDSSKIIARDPWFVDMMFEALEKEHGIELLTLLKKYGANFNVKKENRETLLNRAVEALPSFSHIAHMRRDFALAGFNAPCVRDEFEKTPDYLISKVQNALIEDLKLIDFLLENGADPKLTGWGGMTPLSLLIREKDLTHLGDAASQVMDRFLKFGADLNEIDDEGETPLHHAARTGYLFAISYLIQHGALVNQASKQLRTPLHIAAANGNPKSAKLLLELGADATLVDEKGLTASQLAMVALKNEKDGRKFSSIRDESEFEKTYYEIQEVINNARSNIVTTLPKQNLEVSRPKPKAATLNSNGDKLTLPSLMGMIGFFNELTDKAAHYAEENNFKLIDIAGDGNCFFQSIAVALNGLNQGEHTAKSVRRAAVEYMSRQENQPHFREFGAEKYDISDLPHYDTFESYLENMAKEHVWARGAIIDAVALRFNIHLIVTDLRENGNIHFVPYNDNSKGPVVNLLRTGEMIGCQHYRTLIPQNALLAARQDTPKFLSTKQTINQGQVNIVFLDIDGVLLSDDGDGNDNLLAYKKHLEYVKEKLGGKLDALDIYDIGAVLRFNPFAIKNLKKLCKFYDAKIVISSSWRVSNDREGSMNKLTSLFKLWDLDDLIIDVTPTLHTSRGQEIQKWLDTTECNVGSYFILDDVDDKLSKLFGKKYINTQDEMFFSSEHYEEATRCQL